MLVIHICLFVSLSFALDPFVFYNFEVSYITASPLGVPQQVCSSDLSLLPCLLYFHFQSHLLSLLSTKLFMWGCSVFINEIWVAFSFCKVSVFSSRSSE